MNDHSPKISAATPLDTANVFEQYLKLRQLAAEKFEDELGGRLVLYGEMDERGSAVALAASIAGAASLGISADGDLLKLAIRSGVCDFMVNTLDEALRILKNEIRKKQPVSVGLQQEFVAAIVEIVERGVQPDILALTAKQAETCAAEYASFLARGSSVLADSAGSEAVGSAGVWWRIAMNPAQALPKLDAIAAEVLGDEVRGRWLRLAPRYLGRRANSTRYVMMTDGELKLFHHGIEKAVAEKRVEGDVSIRHRGGEIHILAGK